MARQEGPRAASLPEMLLIVCLVALFAGAAVQGLSTRAGAAQAQNAGSTGPAPSQGAAQKPDPQPPGLAAAAARPQTVAEKIVASQQLLDINTATPEQLTALPGMGAAYAARVIAGRPYSAKNQLVTRGLLPKDVYERIRELIIAHRPK